MKEGKEITLGLADSTTGGAFYVLNVRQNDLDHVLEIGHGLNQRSDRAITAEVEHYHQGSIKSYGILYQDAAGLGGEVTWDGEKELSRRADVFNTQTLRREPNLCH